MVSRTNSQKGAGDSWLLLVRVFTEVKIWQSLFERQPHNYVNKRKSPLLLDIWVLFQFKWSMLGIYFWPKLFVSTMPFSKVHVQIVNISMPCFSYTSSHHLNAHCWRPKHWLHYQLHQQITVILLLTSSSKLLNISVILRSYYGSSTTNSRVKRSDITGTAALI